MEKVAARPVRLDLTAPVPWSARDVTGWAVALVAVRPTTRALLSAAEGKAPRLSSGRPSVLAEQARVVQLLVERVDVQEDVLEVRIGTEGLVSLVGELRQDGERRAA